MFSVFSDPRIFFSRLGRRAFIGSHLAALAYLALPVSASARQAPERSLSFFNLHTGETLENAVYWAEGKYNPAIMREVEYILRDFRRDEVAPIDPLLLDQLFAVRSVLETSTPFNIISGYRSPETNQMLRQQSSGVAKRSYHTIGQAVDVRLPGRELKALRQAARRLKRGGVGYYPKSDFVHLDTGPVRAW